MIGITKKKKNQSKKFHTSIILLKLSILIIRPSVHAKSDGE